MATKRPFCTYVKAHINNNICKRLYIETHFLVETQNEKIITKRNISERNKKSFYFWFSTQNFVNISSRKLDVLFSLLLLHPHSLTLNNFLFGTFPFRWRRMSKNFSAFPFDFFILFYWMALLPSLEESNYTYINMQIFDMLFSYFTIFLFFSCLSFVR